MGIRRVVALVVLVVLAGGAALSTSGGDDDHRVTMEAAARTGAPGKGIVFYAGLGNDQRSGVAVADQYSDWEFVVKNDLENPAYSMWAEGKCSPDGASTFPSDRGLHVLVGYSLGRQGPVFLLRHRSRWDEIDTIWLLDPGTKEEMESPDSCEIQQDGLRHPGEDFAEWLAGSPNRRLIVIAAAQSNSDSRAGLDKYYLNDIRSAAPDVASRAFLCIDPSTGHLDVPSVYMPLIAATKACPAPATAGASGPLASVPAPTQPPHTTPPATSPPLTSPSATTPPATAPQGTGPPATSPPQTSPPATSPPTTSPPTTSPPTTQPRSRVITIYNMVTNGGTQMREDSPAYLSTVTQNFCKSNGCALAGTDMGTGAQITATCQTQGARTTNGQDNSSIDDGNPGLYQSTRWYGIRWGDGRFGYISEVWINSADRGGLGLPTC